MLSRLGLWDFWRRIPLRLLIQFIDHEHPRRFPETIQIEPTSKCNLRCPACSHAREKDAGRHLVKEDFKKILDRLPWTPKSITLSGIGEPLISPHFFSLVDILAERKIRCVLYTNGTLLTPRTRKAIISRRNIEDIFISCDGAEKMTFENLRVGASFEHWKKAVFQLFTEAKEQSRQTMRISAHIVLCKQNLDQVTEIIRLTADLGFYGVQLFEPVPHDNVVASICPSREEMNRIRQEDLFKLARALRLRTACHFRRYRLPPKSVMRCIQPWEYIFIRANGDIFPCYAIFGYEKGALMGNIFQQDFMEIWRGDCFRKFRRTSAAGTNMLCRICPYY